MPPVATQQVRSEYHDYQETYRKLNSSSSIPCRFARVNLVLLCLLWSQILFAMAGEEQLYLQLTELEHQIHVDPLKSYQELQSLEVDIQAHAPRIQSVFYLRKAQAENFLYLYDEFADSIAEGAAIADDEIPAQVSIWYDIYQCIIYQRNNKYQKSSDCYKNTIQQAKQQNDTKALVFALQEFAYAESLNESYAAALDYLQEAHRLATDSNQPFLMGIVRESYGAVYGYLDDYENSIEHYQIALTIYEDLGFKTYMAEAHYGLASTYRYWGELDLALSHYQKFQEVFGDYHNTHHRFLALYGLAMTYAVSGDCPLSLEAMEEAVSFPGLNDYRAELYKKQALCLVEIGTIPEARLALENARQLFDQIPELNGTTWQLELLQIEALILAAEDSFQKAFALMAEFHESYLKRFEENTSSRLTSMRVNMESRRKDLEIEHLKKEKLLDAIELGKQQQENEIQKYITIIWIIIAGAFVLLIVFQRRITKKFMKLSFHDPLTQLYNRRYIFNLLNNLIAKTQQGKIQLALILMDIDNFKQINDTYGHATGDKVLCKLSEICLNELRHSDSIGRIGGEEFLIVLPRESEEQTHMIAERLRQAVEKTHIVSDNNEKINFTISVGITRLRKDCTDAKVLFKQADQALYQAKQEGKNRIVEYL
jgi:diguanylate cyclase (GGDEF)-like protein